MARGRDPRAMLVAHDMGQFLWALQGGAQPSVAVAVPVVRGIRAGGSRKACEDQQSEQH